MADLPDLLKRIKTADIYSPLFAKVQQLLANCEAQGARYYAISGYRSVEEQDGLYAQGRTKTGKVVTNAKGGQSAHNFGLAVDFCKDADMTRAGLQPDWDMPDYKVLAEEAKKLGLEAGLYWKFTDAPHIQLPLGEKGLTLFKDQPGSQSLLSTYQQSGLDAVWARLDQFGW